MIVWLASYPKSGNTWVRSFLSAYYFSENGIFNSDLLKNIKQYPSSYFFNQKIDKPNEIQKYWSESQEKILSKKEFKILKTHNSLSSIDSFPFTSPKYTIGVVYILRDPRNVISSLKNHYDLDYTESLKFMLNEKKYIYDNRDSENIDYANFHFLGSWSNHYKSWVDNNLFRRMVIKYEDLIKNTYEVFRDLIVFMNTLTKLNQPIDSQKLNNSIESTRFDNLKKLEENDLFNENVFSKDKKRKIKFFNQGAENQWKKNIPLDLQKNINSSFETDLRKLGYLE